MSYPYSDIIGLHRCIIDLSGRWPASWSCLSINASRFTGWILMALMHAGFVQMAFAVTYNTISNGPWTSTSTWQGGVVPGATINAVDVVNVTHEVSYTNSNDLRILGTLNIFGGGLITPGNSSRNITVQSGGELNMNDACLEFSANFNNENGSLNIENPILKLARISKIKAMQAVVRLISISAVCTSVKILKIRVQYASLMRSALNSA